jgi:peroxiredoxin Q/BCP
MPANDTGPAAPTPPLPAVGSPAPTFRLAASTGETIDLAEVTRTGRAVLFFYPKADTPGCTKEACGFRDAIEDYRAAGVTVLGISPDPVKRVTKFADKFAMKFPLLADEDHAVADRYGLWQEKSMYGRKYMGVARTTFVVDQGGKVLHVFEKVKPEGHDQEVLAWLRKSQNNTEG